MNARLCRDPGNGLDPCQHNRLRRLLIRFLLIKTQFPILQNNVSSLETPELVIRQLYQMPGFFDLKGLIFGQIFTISMPGTNEARIVGGPLMILVVDFASGGMAYVESMPEKLQLFEEEANELLCTRCEDPERLEAAKNTTCRKFMFFTRIPACTSS